MNFDNKHLEIGKMGEEIARKFLENKGYKIIEQNYRTKYAEIDLITKLKGELVFVEVRTKVGENFGSPEDTLDYKKKRKIYGNAMAYVGFKKWAGPFRIDAVCIVLNPNCTVNRLDHYENII